MCCRSRSSWGWRRYGAAVPIATSGRSCWATVVLMGAPLAHVVGQVPALHAFPPVILLPLAAFYFASAIHDRWTDGRVHPISLWGAIALLVWAQGRAVLVGPSEAWHRFAAWLIA